MYKLTDTNSVIRISDNAHIPSEPGNRDYAEYQEWLSRGNSPLSPDPKPDNTRMEALAKLKEIDLKSIRSLREWLASQEGAPEWIKAREAEAQTERGKLG